MEDQVVDINSNKESIGSRIIGLLVLYSVIYVELAGGMTLTIFGGLWSQDGSLLPMMLSFFYFNSFIILPISVVIAIVSLYRKHLALFNFFILFPLVWFLLFISLYGYHSHARGGDYSFISFAFAGWLTFFLYLYLRKKYTGKWWILFVYYFIIFPVFVAITDLLINDLSNTLSFLLILSSAFLFHLYIRRKNINKWLHIIYLLIAILALSVIITSLFGGHYGTAISLALVLLLTFLLHLYLKRKNANKVLHGIFLLVAFIIFLAVIGDLFMNQISFIKY